MKTTFEQFTTQDPFCEELAYSESAQYIFEHILSRDDSIIAMIDQIHANPNLPALAARIHEVEDYLFSLTDSALITDTLKQGVGRMVGAILKPFGYASTEKVHTFSKSFALRYFTSATVFAPDPAAKPSMRVESVKVVREMR